LKGKGTDGGFHKVKRGRHPDACMDVQRGDGGGGGGKIVREFTGKEEIKRERGRKLN